MKILVLGAGYVGSAFASYYHAQHPHEHEIIASTTSPDKVDKLQKLSSKAILLHNSQPEELQSIIQECDAIAIMVAPKANVSYSETYKKTALAIETALQHRDRPFYILYTSSTRVYDSLKEIDVQEDDVIPNSQGDAKILLETEEIYQRCQNEFVQTCILRLGGIYGPGRRLQDRALRLSGKEVAMNGEAFTNHIHLDDIVQAIAFCVEAKLKGIYNLVNDAHPTRKELYETYCDKLGKPFPMWKPDIILPSDHGHCVDNSKIKKTGYQFTQPEISYLIDNQ